jgi:hypothetical protein
MAGRVRSAIGLGLALSLGPGCSDEKVTSPAALAIQCSASPTAGAAPLTVAFGLDVANAVGSVTVSISYGDGQTGTDPAARHVYSSAGDYMAALAVTAGVESARCSVPITVQSAAPASPSPSPSVPNPPGNQQPIASFKTTPEGSALAGKAPFTVLFNMCRSVDPDGDRMLFRMDLDGDGSFEFMGSSGSDCRHEMAYAVGTRTATICVADVNCPSWPLCNAYQPLHPYQCASYTITAVP